MVELMEFRNSDVGATSSDDGDDLCRVTSTETKTLDKKPISCDDGFGLPCLGVDGWDASSLLCFIVDVVVNEGGGVDEFEGQRKRHDVLFRFSSSKLVGQEEQNRSEAFSSSVQNPPCFKGDLPCSKLKFLLDEVMKGLVHLFTHGFQC